LPSCFAQRAYYEWIPIRQVNISDGRRIWRDFQFGDLVSLHALDVGRLLATDSMLKLAL
jgi:alkaline phosphatase D